MADPRPLLVPLDDDEEEVDGPVDPGTLLRWDKGDGTPSGSLGLLGVRTIILCLIMTLGRVIADGEWKCAPGACCEELILVRPFTFPRQATKYLS